MTPVPGSSKPIAPDVIADLRRRYSSPILQREFARMALDAPSVEGEYSVLMPEQERASSVKYIQQNETSLRPR